MSKLAKLGNMRIGNRKDGAHVDNAQGLLFAEQLTLIEQTIVMQPYAARKVRSFFPVDTTGGPGVAFRKWRTMDRVGHAKALADYAKGIPRVTITGKQYVANAKSYAIGYGWNQEQLDEFLFAGQPLETAEASAAREGYEDTFEKVATEGDPDTGLQGIIDHPNIPVFTGGGTWASATADAMIGDIAAAFSGQQALTKEIESSNLVLMAPSLYDKAMVKRLSSDTAMTVLEFLRKAYPGVVFDKWWRLETASATGGPAICGFTQNADALYVWEPQPFQTYPVQTQGFEFEVPCKGKMGGAIVKRPLAHFRIDNLG